MALLQVFFGIPFKQGDVILTSQAEYGSNYLAYLQVGHILLSRAALLTGWPPTVDVVDCQCLAQPAHQLATDELSPVYTSPIAPSYVCACVVAQA